MQCENREQSKCIKYGMSIPIVINTEDCDIWERDAHLAPLMRTSSKELGDTIHEALKAIGITPEAVEQFIGVPCGCKERQEKLNQVSRWAKRVVAGSVDNAKGLLDKITGADK